VKSADGISSCIFKDHRFNCEQGGLKEGYVSLLVDTILEEWGRAFPAAVGLNASVPSLSNHTLACVIGSFIYIWHAPLGVQSAKRRHQSPEWTILSHARCCFIWGEVIGFLVCWARLNVPLSMFYVLLEVLSIQILFN